MDQDVHELIDKEQRKHHSEQNEARYVGVLCDMHRGTEMERVIIHHGHGIISTAHRGFRCKVEGCKRFFGVQGYADLTDQLEIGNVLDGPDCPQSPGFKMYLRKDAPPSGLIRWVCAKCNEERSA